MTHSVGGTIQASDINAWLTTINNVYGVGSGNRGYGQTSLQSVVSAGDTITSAQWTNLRTMIQTCATHQGTSITDLVPASLLEAGDIIRANIDGDSPNQYDIAGLVTAVDTNRLTASTDMALTASAHTLTKAASWSTSTTCSVDVQFSSENHARYFFNTGGELRIRLTATSTLAGSGTSQDVEWRNMITNGLGTFTFKANTVTRSGSLGSITGPSGYYGLTGSSATVYNGTNIGSGAYSANDITISAHATGVAGVNGGNGTTIRFVIVCADQHTNVSFDTVSAGLTANFDYYKVNTTVLPGAISAPTFSTVSVWS